MADFGDILARVTIRDILRDVGLDPSGSRMPCPIHGGTNPTAFSFTDQGFCCFACGAKGGLLDLAEYLYHCSRQEAVKRLCGLAGLPYNEAATRGSSDRWKELASLRRPSDPLRGDPRCQNLVDPTFRNLAQGPSALLKERLESEELHRHCWETRLKISRRLMQKGKMPLEAFYAEEQKALYYLEDIDREIAVLKCELNRIRKGHRYGNHPAGHNLQCVRG